MQRSPQPTPASRRAAAATPDWNAAATHSAPCALGMAGDGQRRLPRELYPDQSGKPHKQETSCSNSDQHANTAIQRCHRIHLRRASAHMNVRSVPTALMRYWTTSVRIAAVALYPGQSDRRRTGKVITILAKTRPDPGQAQAGRSRRARAVCHRNQVNTAREALIPFPGTAGDVVNSGALNIPGASICFEQ